MSWFSTIFGATKPTLPKSVGNVDPTLVPTGVQATQLQVTGSPVANVAKQSANAAKQGAVAPQMPANTSAVNVRVDERRGEYVALGGSRKGKKSKSKKSKKSKKSRKSRK